MSKCVYSLVSPLNLFFTYSNAALTFNLNAFWRICWYILVIRSLLSHRRTEWRHNYYNDNTHTHVYANLHDDNSRRHAVKDAQIKLYFDTRTLIFHWWTLMSTLSMPLINRSNYNYTTRAMLVAKQRVGLPFDLSSIYILR